MEYVQLPGANLQGANIEGLILDCGGYIPGSILNSNSDCHISLKNTDFSNTKGFPKNWDTGKYFQTYMIENLNLTGSDMQKKIDAEKRH